MSNHIGRELAKCLSSFSLDIIGIVSAYAREPRLVRSFALKSVPICMVVGPRAELIVAFEENLTVFSNDGKILFELDIVRVSGLAYSNGILFVVANWFPRILQYDEKYQQMNCTASEYENNGFMAGIAVHNNQVSVCTTREVQVFSGCQCLRNLQCHSGSFLDWCLDCAFDESGWLYVGNRHDGISIFNSDGKFVQSVEPPCQGFNMNSQRYVFGIDAKCSTRPLQSWKFKFNSDTGIADFTDHILWTENVNQWICKSMCIDSLGYIHLALYGMAGASVQTFLI